jgi:hypothetical protein
MLHRARGNLFVDNFPPTADSDSNDKRNKRNNKQTHRSTMRISHIITLLALALLTMLAVGEAQDMDKVRFHGESSLFL